MNRIFTRNLLTITDVRNMTLSNKFNSKQIDKARDSIYSVEPFECLQHRRIQEILQDNGFKTSKFIWKQNNHIIHNFNPFNK